MFDIPFGLNHLIIEKDLHNQINHPVITKQSSIDAQDLNDRIQSFRLKHFSPPKFWQVKYRHFDLFFYLICFQLGSMRTNDQINNSLSKEMTLTMGMLFGGTPIVLYGEELALEHVRTINKVFLIKYFCRKSIV